MKQRQRQISVPLPADLEKFVELQAQQQDRSLAGVVRRLIAEAARQTGGNQQARAA
jgi:hypothetical protein